MVSPSPRAQSTGSETSSPSALQRPQRLSTLAARQGLLLGAWAWVWLPAQRQCPQLPLVAVVEATPLAASVAVPCLPHQRPWCPPIHLQPPPQAVQVRQWAEGWALFPPACRAASRGWVAWASGADSAPRLA